MGKGALSKVIAGLGLAGIYGSTQSNACAASSESLGMGGSSPGTNRSTLAG